MERGEKDKELKIHESALFTICCTTEMEYTFYEAMGQTMYDVFPAPVCLGISLDSVDMEAESARTQQTAFITGKNFTDNLGVWFGTFKCNSHFR